MFGFWDSYNVEFGVFLKKDASISGIFSLLLKLLSHNLTGGVAFFVLFCVFVSRQFFCWI